MPSFISFDPRLPNPERPYVMTSGNAVYLAGPTFALYELSIQPTYPNQINPPFLTMAGPVEFDSIFDVSYDAVVSFGLAPPFAVSGQGAAHVVGTAPLPPDRFTPAIFETELVSLELFGLSPQDSTQFQFRESPTLRSSGVTTQEGACYGPICPAVVLPIRVSSYFDVYTEVSFDGGQTWTPARDGAIHLEQTPEPGTGLLLAVGGGALWIGARGRKRRFLS